MKAEDRILDMALEEVLGGAEPPDLDARIQEAARKAPPSRLIPWPSLGLGLAAGILLTLGTWTLTRGRGPAAWERADSGWRPLAAGSSLAPAKGWREIRLPDGTTVDAAPDARLTLVGRRPGEVLRLEAGTAFFSVPPGKGVLDVGLPGGRVEVLGTAFGITLNPETPKGDETMKRNPWMIGGAAAIVAVGVTSGVVHYVGARDTKPVKAGQELEIDRKGAARLAEISAKEAELANRERTLKAGEEALAGHARDVEAREKRLAGIEKPVPPPPATGEAERLQALEDAAKAAKPAAPKKKSGMAQAMEMMVKMMDSPAAQEQMKAGMKMQIGMLYGDLLKEWGLDPGQQEKVEALLGDRMLGELRLVAIVLDENVSVEEIQGRQDALFAKSEADLGQILSPAQLGRFQDYEKEMPRRMQEQQVDQNLASLNLDPSIRAQVRAAILEEQRNAPQETIEMGMGQGSRIGRKSAEEIRRTREMLTGDSSGMMLKSVEGMKQSNARIVERVRPFLTAEQLAGFQKQQDAQIQMIEMSLKMMESMSGQ